MQAWEANLDVQFVTNVYACVMYVASYMSKSEKTLGDLLKSVSSSGEHLGPKTAMKNVAKKFLSHREVSAQEAVYRLLSLPLTSGSRQVIFIPTDLPENRTRLFKPMKLIEQLDDDDPDVFQKGILDRYPARPQKLNSMCLAEFASTYTYVSKPPKDDFQISDISDDNENDDPVLPHTIQLKNDLGYMTLKKTAAIIRSHQFSEHREPVQYYHALLMLYYPWQDETNDLFQTSYLDSYNAKFDEIQRNRARFEHHSEDVADAIENLAEFGPPEDSWAQLAPQTEQMRDDDGSEGAQTEQNNVLHAFDQSTEQQASRDIGIVPHEYEILHETLTNQQWYEMVLSLNKQQFQLHTCIVKWCTDMLLSHRTEKPDPLHIFLTGGAGVGKSHLVRTIVQTVSRLFSRNNQTQETHIMVCAPTGAAAYNISGYTLHSAFLLPLNVTVHDDYIHLSNEKLASMKETIGNLKLLIIDEISMVGSDMLLTIHRRLCDVMANQEPFGGISVLAVGDLLQLPPVGQKPVFATPSDELAAIYGSLWQNHFQLLNLTEIERQKNDSEFASLLSRIRTGEHTAEDLDLLKTRQTTNIGETTYPLETTHVFAYNRLVHSHNNSVLQTLQTHVFTFNALDSRRDSQTGRVDITSFPEMSGGLNKSLHLAVTARVMLTKNLDVTDGLVNSATGVVTGFMPEPPSESEHQLTNYRPKYILVKFDDDRVGRKCRNSHKALIPCQYEGSTTVPVIEVQVQLNRRSKVTAKRSQFPVTLAWAVTIHKEQGKTEDRLVVSCEGTFHAGQFYTAISRTRTLNGLYIIGDITRNKVKVNTKSLQELNRMTLESKFTLETPAAVFCPEDLYFKISFLNANSFIPHSKCVLTDRYITSAHIICLAETWLTTVDIIPDIPTHFSVRRDLTIRQTKRRSGGLLIYIHYDFLLIKEFHVSNISIQHICVLLSPRWKQELRICVLCLYRNPNSAVKQFLPELEKLLSNVPLQAVPTFVCGDFNVDLLSKTNSVKQLQQLMGYYRLTQYVKTPTHRKGGLLDHVYMNHSWNNVQLSVNPVYYSDHLQIAAAVPFPELH